MTEERNFNRLVQEWFETRATKPPEGMVANILEAVAVTPQARATRRIWRWRLPAGDRVLAISAVALAIVLVASAGIWLGGPRDPVVGPSTSPSPMPSATPSIPPSPTPTASPTATASPSLAPSGSLVPTTAPSTPSPSPTPTPTVPLTPIRNAIAISAGWDFTCALIRGGTVKCWGVNDSGRLGNDTTAFCSWPNSGRPACSSTPVDVAGLSGVTAITLGGYHACAITTQGGIRCWGQNNAGQLGDGTTTDSRTPVDVIGLTSGVTAIAAGLTHTCALTNAGKVKCWGTTMYDGSGNTVAYDAAPVDINGLGGGVTAISAGGYLSCVVTSAGGVKCWGPNQSGQLGDGTTTNRLTPVDVRGLTSGVVSVAADDAGSCAVMVGGTAKCWGLNKEGQLGDGTTIDRHVPVDVVGLKGVVEISVGLWFQTCALTSGGGVKCWGYNAWGQLGNGTTVNSSTPVDVIGLASGVSGITASGYQHACAVLATGGAKCWGGNEGGELGNGTTTDSSTPVDVLGP